MLRYSFALSGEADAIECAVKAVLAKGYRTGDIFSDGKKLIGTKETGDLIANEIK